jgi:hypothetical protein
MITLKLGTKQDLDWAQVVALTDKNKLPIPGPSGKFGWCWRLPEPAWEWPEVEIRQPRTMRLELGDYG